MPATFRYSFDTATAAWPGNGEMNFDSNVSSSIAYARLDYFDYFGNDIRTYLRTIPSSGTITVQSVNTPANIATFNITGAYYDEPSQTALAPFISYVSGFTAFSDGELVDITLPIDGPATTTTTTTTAAPTTTTTTEAPTTTTTSTSSTTTTTTTASPVLFEVDASDNASYSGSGSTWFDISGADRDLTLAGTFSHEINGGFGQFDLNSSATATSPQMNLSGSTSFTISSWVNLESTKSGDRNLIKILGANDKVEIRAFVPDSSFNSRVYYRFNSVGQGYESQSSVVSNVYNEQWAHVVLVYNQFPSGVYTQGAVKVYVNGVLLHDASGFLLDKVSITDGFLNAGPRTDISVIFSGAEFITRAKMTNTLLSDADVTALYNAEVGDMPTISTTTTTTAAPTTTTTTAAPTTTTTTTTSSTTTTTTAAPTTTTTQSPGASMATTIQIKRSSGVSAPSTGILAEGELAYSQDRSNEGAGAILYIESVAADGTTAVVDKVGGKYYTNTVDTFLAPKTASVAAALVLHEAGNNGSNKVSLKAPAALAADISYTLPATITENYFLKTDASGNMSWAEVVSSLSISGDTGSDSINTGETLDFAGTANQIATAVTDNTVTFALTDDVVLVGDLTVGGNDIKMNGGTTALTFSGSGDVAVAGDLKVGGNDILASDGTTALTMAGADVTVAGDLQVSGNDVKMAGGVTALTFSGSGDVAAAGDLKVGGNDILASDNTVAITLSGADVAVAGDLKVGGNDIKASDNTVAITLAGADVTVAGDLQVSGNDVKMAGGTTALTFSGSGDVAVAGDLTVTGNDIKSSSATAITLSGADVAVAGDLKVGGNDIKASDDTVAITLSGADVAVAGDLKVGGNDIKASDGTTAISLSGADVTIAGNLTINGTTTTVNSVTVTVDDNLIKLADNNTANSLDTGVFAKYVESSTDKFAGLFRDASDSNKFKLFVGLEVEPTTTVATGDASYVRGTLEANLSGGTISNLASDLAVADGGTGASTFTANGVLYGNGTDPIQVTAAGTSGQVLQVNGSGVPVFAHLDGGTY